MEIRNEELNKIINASGFLFQLKMEEEVRNTQRERNNKWGVIAREHRWKEDLTGREGYIDLILESGIGRIVIEFKRVREGNWIFLLPNGPQPNRGAKLLWSHKQKDRHNMADYGDFIYKPETAESSFCVVRGQGEKDQPMLERLSSQLIISTECLANEEMEIGQKRVQGTAQIYIPMIVTNSNLYGCLFDVSDVDISQGIIENSDFELLPYISFRKNLSTSIKTQKDITNLQIANIENERSVIIVSATALTDLLKKLTIPRQRDYMIGEKWPWDIARQLEYANSDSN